MKKEIIETIIGSVISEMLSLSGHNTKETLDELFKNRDNCAFYEVECIIHLIDGNSITLNNNSYWGYKNKRYMGDELEYSDEIVVAGLQGWGKIIRIPFTSIVWVETNTSSDGWSTLMSEAENEEKKRVNEEIKTKTSGYGYLLHMSDSFENGAIQYLFYNDDTNRQYDIENQIKEKYGVNFLAK